MGQRRCHRVPTFAATPTLHPLIPLLHPRSNPIAPYKLVIVTSYVVAASHYSCHPLTIPRSQTVPYTVDAGMGLQYVGSVSMTAFSRLSNVLPSEPHRPIPPWNPVPNLHGQLCADVLVRLILTSHHSLTRTGRRGDAKMFIRCTRHCRIRLRTAQTSHCPQTPSTSMVWWRTDLCLRGDGSLR